MSKDKIILVHLDTNEVNIFRLQTGRLKLLKKKQIFFNETLVTGELLRKLDMAVDMLVEDKQEANHTIESYLDFYNNERPHMSLRFMTPAEFLLQYTQRNSAVQNVVS